MLLFLGPASTPEVESKVPSIPRSVSLSCTISDESVTSAGDLDSLSFRLSETLLAGSSSLDASSPTACEPSQQSEGASFSSLSVRLSASTLGQAWVPRTVVDSKTTAEVVAKAVTNPGAGTNVRAAVLAPGKARTSARGSAPVLDQRDLFLWGLVKFLLIPEL